MFLLELVKLAIHQVFTQNCLENTKGKDLTEHVTYANNSLKNSVSVTTVTIMSVH